MKANIHFLLDLAHLFVEWKMFQTKNFTQNQNTHFMFSIFFFSKIAQFMK
jgi:hypothetical protein